MKKFLLKVKIYYKGTYHSKEGDIGYLTLELMVNKEGCENPEDIVEVSNSYNIEGERDVVPVSYTRLNHCSVTRIIKDQNNENRYDSAFQYKVEGTPTFTLRDISVRVQYGWSPVEE